MSLAEKGQRYLAAIRPWDNAIESSNARWWRAVKACDHVPRAVIVEVPGGSVTGLGRIGMGEYGSRPPRPSDKGCRNTARDAQSLEQTIDFTRRAWYIGH